MYIDWAKYVRLYKDKVHMNLQVFKGNTFKLMKVYKTFHNDKNAA